MSLHEITLCDLVMSKVASQRRKKSAQRSRSSTYEAGTKKSLQFEGLLLGFDLTNIYVQSFASSRTCKREKRYDTGRTKSIRRREEMIGREKDEGKGSEMVADRSLS